MLANAMKSMSLSAPAISQGEYHCPDGSRSSRQARSFNRYLISDLDNDGLDDIFLLTHNTTGCSIS